MEMEIVRWSLAGRVCGVAGRLGGCLSTPPHVNRMVQGQRPVSPTPVAFPPPPSIDQSINGSMNQSIGRLNNQPTASAPSFPPPPHPLINVHGEERALPDDPPTRIELHEGLAQQLRVGLGRGARKDQLQLGRPRRRGQRRRRPLFATRSRRAGVAAAGEGRGAVGGRVVRGGGLGAAGEGEAPAAVAGEGACADDLCVRACVPVVVVVVFVGRENEAASVVGRADQKPVECKYVEAMAVCASPQPGGRVQATIPYQPPPAVAAPSPVSHASKKAYQCRFGTVRRRPSCFRIWHITTLPLPPAPLQQTRLPSPPVLVNAGVSG